MTWNPDAWSSKDWKAHDEALARLLGRSADQFARDLDRCGWQITSQGGGDRWPMNGAGECPSWAEAYEPVLRAPPPRRIMVE